VDTNERRKRNHSTARLSYCSFPTAKHKNFSLKKNIEFGNFIEFFAHFKLFLKKFSPRVKNQKAASVLFAALIPSQNQYLATAAA